MEINRTVAAEFTELSSRSAVVGRHTQLVEILGTRIVQGDIPVGQQIVPEQLGEQFGVSRSVVREALRSLEANGLVGARPKLGTHVLPQAHWESLHSDVIRWRINGPHGMEQFAELMDIRTGLEPIAARRCAERRAPTLTVELQAACDQMAAAVASGNVADFTDADIRFHTAIWSWAGSWTFARLADVVAAALGARAALHMFPDHLDEAAVASHRQITEHIVAGNGGLAEEATRDLVRIAAAEVAEFVDSHRGMAPPNEPQSKARHPRRAPRAGGPTGSGPDAT